MPEHSYNMGTFSVYLRPGTTWRHRHVLGRRVVGQLLPAGT